MFSFGAFVYYNSFPSYHSTGKDANILGSGVTNNFKIVINMTKLGEFVTSVDNVIDT